MNSNNIISVIMVFCVLNANINNANPINDWSDDAGLFGFKRNGKYVYNCYRFDT
jgi:hypothetical protein